MWGKGGGEREKGREERIESLVNVIARNTDTISPIERR